MESKGNSGSCVEITLELSPNQTPGDTKAVSHASKNQQMALVNIPKPKPAGSPVLRSRLVKPPPPSIVTPRGQRNDFGSLTICKSISKSKEEGAVPKTGAYKMSTCGNQPKTIFRQFYERGDLPVSVESNCRGCCLKWRNEVDVESLDYHHYLPLFFDGLREMKEPFVTIARQGVQQMIEKGGSKVLPVVPQLIIPIKRALETNNPEIMCRTLECLQQLIRYSDGVGAVMVQYYRQILPPFARFKNKNVNCGDHIDYSQHRRSNVGDLIQETLELLETHGGEDAFINIKYMIPTYESCILN